MPRAWSGVGHRAHGAAPLQPFPPPSRWGGLWVPCAGMTLQSSSKVADVWVSDARGGGAEPHAMGLRTTRVVKHACA